MIRFRYIVAWPINILLSKLNIFIVYRVGSAVGDQLLISSLAEVAVERLNYRVILFCSHCDLFANNPNFYKVIDVPSLPRYARVAILHLLKFWEGDSIYYFGWRGAISFEDYMARSRCKLNHLSIYMSRHPKFKAIQFWPNPKIIFNNGELSAYEKKFKGILPDKYALIQPVGKISYTKNKEWGFDRFQKVVRGCANLIWVQAGLRGDPVLKGVINMVGQTSNIRELAYLIKNSLFVVANEGLYNHISSAFDKKSIVVFGGFSQIELACYASTVPIASSECLTCSPCWKREACTVEGQPCMSKIDENVVINKVQEVYQDIKR